MNERDKWQRNFKDNCNGRAEKQITIKTNITNINKNYVFAANVTKTYHYNVYLSEGLGIALSGKATA